MEILAELLIRDGVSTALIIVLIFIWRDISRISRKVDSFTARLYAKDGRPIYQSVKECDDQMNTCRNDINNIGMKVHQITNDMIRMEIKVATIAEKIKKENI